MTCHYLLAAGPSQAHLHGAHDRTTGTARPGCMARDRGVRVGMGLGWEHSGNIVELGAGEMDQLKDSEDQDQQVLHLEVAGQTGSL